MEKRGKSIMIASGSGGTGKTTLAAGLAVSLALRGRRVLCADLDAGMGNLDLRMGMQQSAVFSLRDILERGMTLRDAATGVEGFDCLYLLGTPTAGYVPSARDLGSEVRAICREGWDVILDCPTGINETVAAARDACGYGLLLCPLSEDSLRLSVAESDFLCENGDLKLRLVAARIPPDKNGQKNLRLTVDDCMDACGLPLGGLFYEDPGVALASSGIPALARSGKSVALKAVESITDRILEGIF